MNFPAKRVILQVLLTGLSKIQPKEIPTNILKSKISYINHLEI
jgi:hypothetical protein